MEKITGNEPIQYQLDWGNQGEKMTGLTIRQHFAGLFMQGIIANYFNQCDFPKGMDEAFSKDAVALADALISELNKTTNQ